MGRLVGGGSAESVFRAVVLGAAASATVAAFARPMPGAALVGLWGAAGAALAAVVARSGPVPDGAFLAALGISLAATLFGWGLATFGRAFRCPDPGAAICAMVAVVAGLTSLRWVDPIAERLPLDRRADFRRAVFGTDLATAAAYDVAGYDRLHAPDVYEDTTIASLPMALPDVLPASAAWTVVGVGLAALGHLVTVARRRRSIACGASEESS